MIYTAPCVMLLMRAYTLRGQVGGGWALEIVFTTWIGYTLQSFSDHINPSLPKTFTKSEGSTV
jgi:hypothetical protein